MEHWKQDLDSHITGHWGEDQLAPEDKNADKPEPVSREEHFLRLNAWRDTPEWKAGAYDFNQLVGQRWEVTREIYWEFLEVLPPVGMSGGSFYMSEALTGNIRSKYIEEGDRYFHEWTRFPSRPARSPGGVDKGPS